MAVVEYTKKPSVQDGKEVITGGIKSFSHVKNAIEYILNPSKSAYSSFVNCYSGTSYDISIQFKNIRELFNKNDKILAHHYVQSFAPDDNITPEQAFEIGNRLAEKMAPGFQVVVSTHIDKDCIHNHIIINSVNPITGLKYTADNTSLAFARAESDKLCREYNLSVIEKDKQNKFKSIDMTTYKLGVKGKSWKIKLTSDLDEALECCKTKDEFIKFFEERDYTIKYRDIHITFQKNGEKKGIRADTLAKQFGAKYYKSNIDKILGFVPELTKDEYIQQKENRKGIKKKAKTVKYKNAYERLEEKYFKFNPPMTFAKSESWTVSKNLFTANPLLFTLKLIQHIFFKSKKRYCRKRKIEHYPKQPLNRITPSKDIYACKSNISYKQLKSAPGETAQIKIYAWQLPRLLSQSFFYHSFIDVNKGVATVYLKEKDLTKLAKALELTDEMFFVKQSEQLLNQKNYSKLKKENSKVNYLVVTEEQRKLLKEHFINFAYFEKEDKYNIVFAPQDKKRIIEILYPERAKRKSQQPKTETAYERNCRINIELKAIAEKTGDKLEYRLVSSTQLHNLEKSDVKFAYFRKEDGRNNIVFLSSDKSKVAHILATKKNEHIGNNNEHINDNITRR